MNVGWESSTIGSVCEVIAGQSPEGKYYNDEGQGLPFYQGKKDFGDKFIEDPTKCRTQITREAIEGDVLMSVRAPVGPVNFSTQRICIGRGLAAIRAGNKLDSSFLYHALQWMQPIIQGNDGAVFPSINRNQIMALPIPLPPLPEQKRIVAILDEAFEAIVTATANTEKNLAKAKELFQSKLHQEFSGSRQDQAVPEHSRRGDVVKAGLELKAISELGIIQTGSTPKTSVKDNFGHDFPFIKPGSFMPDGQINYDGIGLTHKGSKESRIIKSGSVLMVCIGATIGKTGYTDKDICCNQQINAITPAQNVLPKYLYYAFISQDFQLQVLSNAGKATLPIISKAKWSQIPIPLPPLPEQKRIVAILDEAKDYSSNLELQYGKKSEQLIELRQSLLHSAFTGELTADKKAADRTLKEAGL